jgi:hypothetical protein
LNHSALIYPWWLCTGNVQPKAFMISRHHRLSSFGIPSARLTPAIVTIGRLGITSFRAGLASNGWPPKEPPAVSLNTRQLYLILTSILKQTSTRTAFLMIMMIWKCSSTIMTSEEIDDQLCCTPRQMLKRSIRPSSFFAPR